ncbi:lectin-like domain-containing protein, partial [Limosilactobacillus reuteri]|uniref:lectin-like domain-containing protein n=2 Tax=Limosilactobacillus reuteri TaxID=1598 RepID=UPI003D044BD3
MREKKLHYKMYKDGKKFVFAAIATLSFFVFGGVSTVEVHADTTSGNLTAATVNSTSDTKSAAQSAATAASSATKTDSTSASSSSAAKAETTGASSSSATKADSTSASSSSATKADSTSASSSSATKADSTSASSSSAVKTETTSASSQKTSSVKSQAQSLTATTTGKAVRATSTSVKKNSAQTKVSYSTLLQRLRTSKALASDEAALAHVDKDNFLEYFRLNGSATYDAKTGIVTITPDQNNQVGNFSLTSKIDMNNSFTLTGQVNLGSNPNGADGIGFAFHSGNTTDVGIAGGNLGIGGLQDAIGFKLDTFSNNYQVPLSDKNGSEIPSTDPDGFGCDRDSEKAPYGTFVKTSNQEISAWNGSKVQRWWAQNTGKSQALSKADIDGHFHDFVVNYDGATRTLTVSYTQASGKTLTWTTTVASSYQAMAMIVSASTGAYKNLQQFKLTSFDFHEAATVNVKYVDTTGHQLAQGTVNYPDGAYVNGRYTTKQLAIPNYTFIKMDDKSLAANGTLTHAGDNGTVIYVYAPAMTVTTESKKVNETVHYQGAGNQTPADYTAQVTFTRQESTDAVTGKKTYGPWSADQSFDAVKSPKLKGYTADKAQIDEQTVNGDSKNLEFTVTYTADKQKGSVSYVDDTTGKTLKTDSISGTTGSKSSYSTSGSIADYKKQGYELVTDGYPADLTFDNDDKTDQNFTVHLKHQLTPV